MKGKRVGSFNFLQFGSDYDLTPKSNLPAGIRMQTGNYAFKTTQNSTLYFRNAVIGSNTRVNDIQFENMIYAIHLDYNRQFSRKGQELTVLGLLSRNNRDNLEVFLNCREEQVYDNLLFFLCACRAGKK